MMAASSDDDARLGRKATDEEVEEAERVVSAAFQDVKVRDRMRLQVSTASATTAAAVPGAFGGAWRGRPNRKGPPPPPLPCCPGLSSGHGWRHGIGERGHIYIYFFSLYICTHICVYIYIVVSINCLINHIS